MGRKLKYIENLTEEQISSLKHGYSHGKSPLFRRKCHAILLSHARKSTNELASFFNISLHSIREWLKLWEKHGIDGIKLIPGRGRKPKLKISEEKHVKTVKELIKNQPKNLKKVTSEIEVELGVDVSKRTLKRFLKNLNTDGNALDEH